MLSKANISTSTLSWNCGEHSDLVVVGISITKSGLLFDPIVVGSLPLSWMKLFSTAHGLIFLSFSGSILHPKCVGYEWGFDLRDSSSAPGFEERFVFPFCYQRAFFLITLSLISTLQLLLPSMCPSPQIAHSDSFGLPFVLSLVWSSFPQFRQTPFRLHLVFVCPYFWQLWHILAGFGALIQRNLMVVREYRKYMAVLAGWR